jgi:uncharacterized protein (TIGR00730 family)
MGDDLVAVIALNFHHTVFRGAAAAAETLERLGRFGKLALGQARDDRNDARATALAHDAHDAVIRYAVFHDRAFGRPPQAPRQTARVMGQRVGIFCGSHTGNDSHYIDVAADVSRHIVQSGYGIVYGGGRVGLMGVIADAALAAGGEVIGVIPEALASREVAHGRLTQLHVVASMHERKALMADLSDAFVALPGGFGTMDEFCEILTWAQLRIHSKPVALLNCNGYYDELLALFDKMVREGFVSVTNRSLVHAVKTIDELLERIA